MAILGFGGVVGWNVCVTAMDGHEEMTTMSDLLATAEQLTGELEWYASRKKDLSDNAPGSGGQSWADLMLSEINAMRETLRQIAAEHQKNSQGKC